MLPQANSSVVFNTVGDGGGVLLHMDSEVYYGLNPVGVRVWSLLPSCQDLSELCEKIAEDYPDALPDQLRKDVSALVDQLLDAKLLVHS